MVPLLFPVIASFARQPAAFAEEATAEAPSASPSSPSGGEVRDAGGSTCAQADVQHEPTSTLTRPPRLTLAVWGAVRRDPGLQVQVSGACTSAPPMSLTGLQTAYVLASSCCLARSMLNALAGSTLQQRAPISG